MNGVVYIDGTKEEFEELYVSEKTVIARKSNEKYFLPFDSVRYAVQDGNSEISIISICDLEIYFVGDDDDNLMELEKVSLVQQRDDYYTVRDERVTYIFPMCSVVGIVEKRNNE